MTPEGKVKKNIKQVLLAYEGDDLWEYWPVPSGYGRRTVDVLGCFHGKFFAIEAKRPKKEPTALQEQELEKIGKSGGTTFVINDKDSLIVFARWLDSVEDGEGGE